VCLPQAGIKYRKKTL